MRRYAYLFGCLTLVGCAVGTFANGDGKQGFSSDGGYSLNGDGGSMASGASVIYAHSDTELYSLDPTTSVMIDIGPFDDGSGNLSAITDLAVNGTGDVWVNSESAIYRATLPNGQGPVTLSLVANIALGSGQYFYALGFAPAGVLGTGETLVAGDNNGVLYAIETNGQTTELGSFGTNSSGSTYELSGDVMFFMQSGTPRGLATVRTCGKSGTCDTTNDILAEINVPAMTTAYQTKTVAASLTKQLLGSGTGYGRLFGIGAWNNQVFAFSRTSGDTPAQLIAIDGTGTGQVVQSFAQITGGWSGAGVTTTATVTILPN
jgi:hypothetical protein